MGKLARGFERLGQPAQQVSPLQKAADGLGHPVRDVIVDVGTQKLQTVGSHGHLKRYIT